MKFKWNLLGVLIGIVFPITSAGAWDDMQRIRTAQALGSVLGSEQACNLRYNQSAIQQFIADHIPASDMQFAGQLMIMTQGSEYELQNMSTSVRTAHCTQTARVAKSYGFID
ncbi:signal recognition particle [Roseibium sp.]|uniref:signal recognition particle n=1 Tax=Roseibium sp. TaxID=1936156 RepID=UPI003BACC6DF